MTSILTTIPQGKIVIFKTPIESESSIVRTGSFLEGQSKEANLSSSRIRGRLPRGHSDPISEVPRSLRTRRQRKERIGEGDPRTISCICGRDSSAKLGRAIHTLATRRSQAQLRR